MELNELKKIKKGFTHAGKFHADDVFSTAFLNIIMPNIRIERGFDVPLERDVLVYDIGMGEFDHHQINNESRDNGIPYAAFGKLWNTIAKFYYSDYVVKKIDRSFISDLDLSDNTGIKNSLAQAIDAFNPQDKTKSDEDFFAAVSFAKEILVRLINKCLNQEKDFEIVKKIYDESIDKKIIVMDKYYYYHDYLPLTDAIYVVYPNIRGGYAAQAITISPEKIESKIPFPIEWLNELPKGIDFCHNSRFLIAGKNLEDVINACKIALNGGLK